MRIVFLNGLFINADEAKIPIDDRGFLFGDGVFATLKVSNGLIENLDAHLLLLESQCHHINLSPPTVKKEWFRNLVLKNNALVGVWRLKIIVTGGKYSGELNLNARVYGHLLITLEPVHLSENFFPRLTVFPSPLAYTTSKIKSLAYLERLSIKEYALKSGFDDAVVLSPEGFILEAAFSNIFWRYERTVYVPDPSLYLRYGTTIQVIEKAISVLGYTLNHTKTSLTSIPPNAQVFVCNSIVGILIVCSINDKRFERDVGFEKEIQLSYKNYIYNHSLNCNES